MEVVIILIVVGAVLVAIFRKFSSLVYYLMSIDILLRLLTYIKGALKINELTNFLNKYFPENLCSIFDRYTSGIFNQLLFLMYFIVVIVFEVYIIRTFIKKK